MIKFRIQNPLTCTKKHLKSKIKNYLNNQILAIFTEILKIKILQPNIIK